MIARAIFAIPLCLAIAACASSSQLLTGMPRSAIPPAQVRVYTMAPASFEEIAVLGASRKSVSTAGGERAIARMIESMRAQAAQLGANGLLLEDFSDSDPVSVGTRCRIPNLYAQCVDQRGRRRFPGRGQEGGQGAGDFRRAFSLRA